MSKITRRRRAGTDHDVVTVESEQDTGYRCKPCAQCPWRTDQPAGRFPAEAYRHSAPTAYDMAKNAFACHMSGVGRPQTCAGFLLSEGAVHNLQVRLKLMRGAIDLGQVKSRHQLYPSYRAMAVANGVPADDPILGPCRP